MQRGPLISASIYIYIYNYNMSVTLQECNYYVTAQLRRGCAPHGTRIHTQEYAGRPGSQSMEPELETHKQRRRRLTKTRVQRSRLAEDDRQREQYRESDRCRRRAIRHLTALC